MELQRLRLVLAIRTEMTASGAVAAEDHSVSNVAASTVMTPLDCILDPSTSG